MNKEDKAGMKCALKICAGLLLFAFAILICWKLLIPTMINLLQTFLALVRFYPLLEDPNYKFLGGIFFVFVIFKIFEGSFYIMMRCFNKGGELIFGRRRWD